MSNTNNSVSEKRKWVRKIGLNKKGRELVSLFDKCKTLDEKDREVYKFYVQNKLKFDLNRFEQYQTSAELEGWLLNEKNFAISKKEQLEDAVDFIFEILNNDMVHLEAHTDARTNTINLIHAVELTKEEAENMFLDTRSLSTTTVSSFIHQFVNLYMIKNANSYLAMCNSSGKFKVTTEQGRANSFNISFTFDADDLDEEMLEEIGTIVMNIPKLA